MGSQRWINKRSRENYVPEFGKIKFIVTQRDGRSRDLRPGSKGATGKWDYFPPKYVLWLFHCRALCARPTKALLYCKIEFHSFHPIEFSAAKMYFATCNFFFVNGLLFEQLTDCALQSLSNFMLILWEISATSALYMYKNAAASSFREEFTKTHDVDLIQNFNLIYNKIYI